MMMEGVVEVGMAHTQPFDVSYHMLLLQRCTSVMMVSIFVITSVTIRLVPTPAPVTLATTSPAMGSPATVRVGRAIPFL